MMRHSRSAPILSSTAMGERPADIILKNCRLINVYTRETIPDSQVAVSKNRIAYVGPDASHAAGAKTAVIDLGGSYLAPGLADPHTHIDQFVLPSELATESLLRGVTSLFSDPIDMTSVSGYPGFAEFVKLCQNIPVRIFNVIPGGLPVDPKFSGGRRIAPAQLRRALKLPGVVGMGEVFSWTRVTMRDPDTMRSIGAMLDAGCIINGHTAGASGRKLDAYVASGIISCHEPINWEQVRERLRLGMWIMMRDGSIRRDLPSIIPGLLQDGSGIERLMFCSDGVDPADLAEHGHVDHCVREAISLGMRPEDALAAASRNCFEYYNMGRDIGGIAPGRLADMIVLDDLESMIPRKVFVDGRLAVSNGHILGTIKRHRVPRRLLATVKLRRLHAGDFAVASREKSTVANTIRLESEIITSLGSVVLRPDGSGNQRPADDGVCRVAAFERILGTGRSTVGFLENFGEFRGAFASTWSFHENDLVVIGSDESDMAQAANLLRRSGGGICVVRDGRILSMMRLRVGGILSTEPFQRVREEFASLLGSLADSGCTMRRPHLVPVFLTFLALPSVRIMHRGIIDVRRRVKIPALRAG